MFVVCLLVFAYRWARESSWSFVSNISCLSLTYHATIVTVWSSGTILSLDGGEGRERRGRRRRRRRERRRRTGGRRRRRRRNEKERWRRRRRRRRGKTSNCIHKNRKVHLQGILDVLDLHHHPSFLVVQGGQGGQGGPQSQENQNPQLVLELPGYQGDQQVLQDL